VTLSPGVSVVNVLAPHPIVSRIIDSGSTTDQLRVTLLLYQPLAGRAGEYSGVTTGGVGSPGTLPAPGARSSAPIATQARRR
jgi:hypothetical protein